MNSDLLTRRIALIAGGAALVGMGMFTAGCSNSTKESPTSTTPSATSTSTPAVSPTEKAVTQPVVPSIENRGGMDAAPCGPGKAKVNGVCQ